jgi:hypothetical protein
MGDDEPAKTRKGPSPNIGLQQRMPVKQLVYTPKCVILTFVIFGIIFIIIGIICALLQVRNQI